MQEKDTNPEDLKILIKFRREDADGQSSTDVAKLLYDLARLYLSNGNLSYALDAIEESIEIYHKCLKETKTEWVKKALSKAELLKRRIG